MFTTLFNWLSGFRPPHPLDNGEKEIVEKLQMYEHRLRAWQWKVFYTMSYLTIVSWMIFVVLTTGIPAFGVSRVTWAGEIDGKVIAAVQPVADEVSSIKGKLAAIKLTQDQATLVNLKQQLFETKVAHCKAKKLKPLEQNNPYTNRLAELQDAFFALTGRAYPLPICDDL